MFKEKSILVTGGAGFVGANLAARLVSLGAKVRATLHSKDAAVADDRIEYVRCDLQRAEDCARVCENVEFVFHFAAVSSGAAVMESTPLAHLTPNLVMNARLLEAAYAAGVRRVLFPSSNTVYPVSDQPMREQDCVNEFFDKYFIVAWMKRFSELICQMYATRIKTPMATVVVRPANVYGPLDDFEWETSHVLPALIRRVVERHDPIQVWGDGSDIKDFVYVHDFIDGVILAMEKLDTFDTVNIASGRQYCLRDLLHLIIELDGFANARIEYDKTKPTMIPKRLIDPSKAARQLGFVAKTPIEEGLRETIGWYRSTL